MNDVTLILNVLSIIIGLPNIAVMFINLEKWKATVIIDESELSRISFGKKWCRSFIQLAFAKICTKINGVARTIGGITIVIIFVTFAYTIIVVIAMGLNASIDDRLEFALCLLSGLFLVFIVIIVIAIVLLLAVRHVMEAAREIT